MLSETVQLALISSGTTVVGLFIAGYVNYKQNKKIKEEVVVVKDEVVGVKDKVEDVHQDVNGKMQKFLDTAEALGVEKGKAQEKAKEETDKIKDILDKNGIH